MANIASLDLSQFIGVNIGTVTLVKLLGQGAMGAVFIGYQATLKRQVAVKILPKSLASSANAQQMFRDEAETVGILNHPNIVPVYEMGETADFFFQVMQLVVGHDLRTIIAKARKHPVPTKRILPVSETVSYIRQILDALGYAHDEGVFHQDIKPANILVDDRFKRALVADFGIARTLWAEYSTVAELIKRKRTEPDTFFTARPSEINPSISSALEEMIFKATAADPKNRFADCLEFKTVLEAYVRSSGLM